MSTTQVVVGVFVVVFFAVWLGNLLFKEGATPPGPVKEIILSDGTRCAVWHNGGIDCDWGRGR